MSFIGDAVSAISSAYNFISGPAQAIGSSIGGITSILSNVENTVSGIVNPIENLVSGVSSAISSVVDPIKGTIDSITGLARSINDGLVQPVSNLINSTITTATDLTKEVEQALQGNISDIANISNAVANTLTNFDTSIGRAQQELGLKQEDIAKATLVPGIDKGFVQHAATLLKSFGDPEGYTKETAAFTDRVKLVEPLAVHSLDDLISLVNRIKGENQNYLSSWGDLVVVLLAIFPYIAELIRNFVRDVGQEANKNYPTELIDVATTIEAWRRGILSEADAKNELERQGFDASRIKALYDVAEFLFSPRDAVELFYRGIITSDQLTTILDQNNLSSGQAASIFELMRYVFGAGDGIRAYYRGFIDDAGLTEILKANHLAPNQFDIAKALEVAPLEPKARIEAQGRLDSIARQFLATTFAIPVPAEVEDTYRKAQLPPEQAQLDWIRHWRTPRADWWIEAVFRQIRTKTEAYDAFAQENIPQEIWEDMFAVARELMPFWFLPNVLAAGVYPEALAKTDIMAQGFNSADADVIIQYGKVKGKTTKSATAADIAHLSLATIKDLFNQGAIDQTEYNDLLVAHGMGPEAAQLTVEAQILANETVARKTYGDDIVNQVKLGAITPETAQTDLYTHGFTTAEVDAYLLKIEAAIKANYKIPSKADLDEWRVQGLINDPQYLSGVEQLGYNATFANLYLESLVLKHALKPSP